MNFLYWFLRGIAALILKLFFGLKVYGKENIPDKGAFILVSNHVSYLDPVILGVANYQMLYYMARDSLFNHPLMGWLLPRIGVFPVKRETADFGAIRQALRYLKNDKPLVIFPEGSRAMDDNLQDPLPGVGFIASHAGVPVIPAYIRGSREAFPRHAKFIKPSKISVVFGKQIFVERRMPYQQAATLVMNGIRDLSN